MPSNKIMYYVGKRHEGKNIKGTATDKGGDEIPGKNMNKNIKKINKEKKRHVEE